jgi:hypothetical protein
VNVTITVRVISITWALAIEVVIEKLVVTGAVYAVFPEGVKVAVIGIVLRPLETEHWEEKSAAEEEAVVVGFSETQVSA